MEYIFSFDSSTFSQLTEPPMAHVSATIGHYIFLIGGYRISYDNDLRTIIAFDKHSILYYNVLSSQLDTIECSYDLESIGSFPTEFFCASGMACCSSDNRIYLFGGYSLLKQEAGNALYYIEINKQPISPSNLLDINSICSGKPTARLKFLSGSHDGQPEESHRTHPSYRDKSSLVQWKHLLLVFGGYGSNFHRSDQHDSDAGHDFLSAHGEYISGSGNRGWTNQLLIFDLCHNEWSNPATFGAIPCARAAHSAAVSGCRMFLFGGRLGVQNSSATIRSNQFHYLDIATLHWTRVALPDASIVGRSWTTLSVVAENAFFIVGGFSGDNVPLSDAYVVTIDAAANAVVTKKDSGFERANWDPFIDRNSWNSEERFGPVCRMWHSAALGPDGWIYVVGGCRNNLIFQVERIQTVVERVRAEPLSLYRLCLWSVVRGGDRAGRGRSAVLLDRQEVPERLIEDLMALSV